MEYSYYYTTDPTYGQTPMISPIVMILYLAILFISLIASWKLFTKAGEEGWKSLIPFYNTYTLFKIVYGNGWRFLLLLIPIVNIVIIIKLYLDMAKAYGKPAIFGVGLLFLNFIFVMILSFGSAKYKGPVGK